MMCHVWTLWWKGQFVWTTWHSCPLRRFLWIKSLGNFKTCKKNLHLEVKIHLATEEFLSFMEFKHGCVLLPIPMLPIALVMPNIYPSPRPYIMFYHIPFCSNELLASCAIPTLEYYHFSTVCECLCHVHKYSPCLEAIFSICNFRTCHVVMKRDPHNMESYAFNSAAEHIMLPFAVAVFFNTFLFVKWECLFYVIHTVHVLTINISPNICTLWYTSYDIYQLLLISASRCHPQVVITTKV